MKTNRDLNLDFIRVVAMTTVFAVHFFLNSGFYDTMSGGWAMTLGILVRTQFMVCVPLFLVLTGYLQKKRTWSWDHYRSIGPFLITYVLASIACAVYRGIFLSGTWSPKEWLRGILSFQLAPYSWYIELYLGLFLLIPFLNAMWRGLSSKRAKQCLVLTVAFLSIAPSLNVISMHFNWQVILRRWDELYPVAYYFVGCYLQEYPPKWNWKWFLLSDIAATLMGGLLHAYRAIGETFQYFELTYWNGLFTFVATISVFQILRSCHLTAVPPKVQRAISLIASLSLPAFLVSWIPDQIAYGILNRAVPTMTQRFPWGLLTVPFVFVVSVLLSLCLEQIRKLIQALFGRLRSLTPSP